MFSASIFVVEADLHDKPATTNSSKSNSNNNNGISRADMTTNNDINIKAKSTTPTTMNNKAPVKTTSANGFLPTPVPKPEPVSELPTSETVDDALGPKPEPIPRPHTSDPYPPPAPISWKVLWASLSAPINPSV